MSDDHTGRRPAPGDNPRPGASKSDEASAASGDGDDARIGRNELGTISVSDQVVTKLAARAAAEHPDAGAAAARILGLAVPGAGHLGVRSTDLGSLPKTTVEVDRSKAFVRLELSVRWPCSVPTVTAEVRERVRARLDELVGLSVDEVHITVTELVTDLVAPPRVH